MKIAFVGGFAFSPKGTMQARAFPLASELVERGHEVSIFLTPYDNPNDSGREWTRAGVRVCNMKTGSSPVSIHAYFSVSGKQLVIINRN